MLTEFYFFNYCFYSISVAPVESELSVQPSGTIRTELTNSDTVKPFTQFNSNTSSCCIWVHVCTTVCVFEHHLCWVIGLWRVWTLTVVAVEAHDLCGDTDRLKKTRCQNEKRHFWCYNAGPPTQLQTDKKKVCSCSDIFNKTAIQASNSWMCQITKEKHDKNQNSFSPLIFQLPLTLYFLSSVSGPTS